MDNFVQGFGFGILFWVIISFLFDSYVSKISKKIT